MARITLFCKEAILFLKLAESTNLSRTVFDKQIHLFLVKQIVLVNHIRDRYQTRIENCNEEGLLVKKESIENVERYLQMMKKRVKDYLKLSKQKSKEYLQEDA